MRRWSVLPAVILMLALCAGCSNVPVQSDEVGQSYHLVDALGREVEIRQPRRVVALMGSFAETWLLAGGELVGVTDDAITERALQLPEETAMLGRFNSPSAEAILAAQPDLVLLSSGTSAHVALREVLEGAGIPAVYFEVTHFTDYLEMLRICTQITGRQDLYQTNGEQVQRQIASLLQEHPLSQQATVLLLITWSGGITVQDSSSMAGYMLQELGFVNIADSIPGLQGELSVEHVLEVDPDYILVIPMGNDETLAQHNLRESIESNPVWNGLTAVQENRYLLLPKELFLYKPNARWGESYAWLIEQLVPLP